MSLEEAPRRRTVQRVEVEEFIYSTKEIAVHPEGPPPPGGRPPGVPHPRHPPSTTDALVRVMTHIGWRE